MAENKNLNRIKVALAEKQKTNKWLAEQLDVNPATVSKWCTNSSQPSLDMLARISKVLEMDYTELVRIKRYTVTSSVSLNIQKIVTCGMTGCS